MKLSKSIRIIAIKMWKFRFKARSKSIKTKKKNIKNFLSNNVSFLAINKFFFKLGVF